MVAVIRKANGRYWNDGVEITETEYNALHELYSAKNKWVNDVFYERASIDDCPAAWREEVERRVEERRASIDPDPEIDDSEAWEIIFGGGGE